MTASHVRPATIVFEPLFPDVLAPSRATQGSAGFDLRAHLAARRVRFSDGTRLWEVDASKSGDDWRIAVEPGHMALIPLGFRAQLPPGYEAQVRPRSGAAFKKGVLIPNAPGTVDADYPEEWMVPIRNGAPATISIEHGERIAQAVFHRFEAVDWLAGAVRVTTDRLSGFGSTGR